MRAPDAPAPTRSQARRPRWRTWQARRAEVSRCRESQRDQSHCQREKRGLRESARNASEATRQKAYETRAEAKDFFREQPLVAGLAAITLGAIIGAVIPESEKENELMGETRDRMVDRASDIAREGVDRAKRVAQIAKSAATDEARDM